MQEKLEEKIKDKSGKSDPHLMNCEDCGCLITMDVYKTYKKLYNKGVCGICLGLTEYSRQLRVQQNKK